MGRSNKAPQAGKTPDPKKGLLTTSLYQFLVTPVDLTTPPHGAGGSMVSEDSVLSSPASDLHKGSTDRPIWLDLFKALPTKADLRSTTSDLGAAIRHDIQALRADVQGMTERVSHMEAACNILKAAQNTLADSADVCSDQIRGMVLHIEDLHNRERRNNTWLCSLPETEESALQLQESLQSSMGC
ncbi:Hypothetical predicted protein [Pelobates cultripes]|uniref:Uncharacterized protein n=1 Tax=Pelobates cultripes TaxID=61616 RepID=A0AAD1SIN8_PELCU|nr:Hypothetical predicted protein [Pelobates cultripes]